MCFGGSSKTERSVNHDQIQMMQTLQGNYNTQFAGQSAILNNLNTSASAVLNQGINQYGFNPAEDAALRTQAREGTAQGYNMAKQATGEALASIGGGNTFLPSGTAAGINNANAVKFAQQNAGQQLGITEAGYSQGRQNYLNAAGVLGNVASQMNPLGYAGSATSAGSQAFGGAKDINQQDQAGKQAMFGALGGAVEGGLNFIAPGAGSVLGSL